MSYNNIVIFNLLAIFLILLITFSFLLEKKQLYIKFSYKLKILMEITFFIMLLGLVLSLILMDLACWNKNIYPNSPMMVYTCIIIFMYFILTFKRLKSFKKAKS